MVSPGDHDREGEMIPCLDLSQSCRVVSTSPLRRVRCRCEPPFGRTRVKPPRSALRSEPSVTSRLLHDDIQVKAVGPASCRCKCGQPLRGAFEESIGSNPISSGRMRQGNTDLRQPLPQVTFLDRSCLPPRLHNLMS